MEEEIERPGLFKMMPYIGAIRCPSCDISWWNPQFASDEVYFPSGTRDSDSGRKAVTRAYCPNCGVHLPELPELIRTQQASISPLESMKFVGTIAGIRQFLEAARGKPIQIWEYRVSHSYLSLRINLGQYPIDAFIVCGATRSIQLPRLHWKCNFTLEAIQSPADSALDYEDWALVDEVTPARIESGMIGIFYAKEFTVES